MDTKVMIYSDITNLMKVDFLTGIQRVVREIVIRLIKYDSLKLNLLMYDEAENAYYLLDNNKFLTYFFNHKGEKKDVITDKVINFTDISSGAVFFDIDSVWNSRLKRSWLFPLLKQKGVKIVTQLYDLIPITHPQFAHENTCMNFMIYVGANIEYADLIIVSAKATADALDELCDKLGKERKKCVVVPLGADFSAKNSDEEVPEDIIKIASGRYILMVGTIEPRKNHSLVIDALDSGLAELGINVVFAGRIGWNVEELEKRIREHPLLGKNLFFLEKPNDAVVDLLYKNALAVAFPTFNEGFGLPMIEAFCRRTPVIASDIGVLREVGGEFADYFDPYDKESFIRAVKVLADDENTYLQKKALLEKFVPFTWDDSAKMFLSAVCSVNENLVQVPEDTRVKQMVVLTARNDDILATLPYLEKYMPFITEMVICCPDRNVDELKAAYKGRFELKFLTDSEVLDGAELPEDHQTRNFFLRCLILRKEIIDDVFIMTDDDYRPLREIQIKDFIDSNRYKAYYCYDLKKWDGTYGNPTSFDIGMSKTCQFLSEHGYPTMMYASHQPQIIDKKIFNEMTEKYPHVITSGTDEWSTYFNYGVGTYPDKFDVVPYISMCWPGAKTDWDLYVVPSEFVFENHYSVLYENGQVFEGLSDRFEDISEELISEKIKRYRSELEIQFDVRRVYDDYCSEYLASKNEMPSFTIVCTHDENQFLISTPEYIKLRAGSFTRVHITFDKDIKDWIGSECVKLNYWFTTNQNEILIPLHILNIDMEEPEFMLPMRAPNDCFESCQFHFRVILEDKNFERTIHMKVVTI
ncbi:MAG: glycosyltransferase family 4 protein [Oscillospiraceae bacterium]|nr:glycosyltransferase family 4 protein [Oscillospiraceae bacterium]